MGSLLSWYFLLLLTQLFLVLKQPISTSARRDDVSFCVAPLRPYCSPREQVKLSKNLKRTIERRVNRVLNCAREKSFSAAANATKSLIEMEFFCPKNGHQAELCPSGVAELETLFECICNSVSVEGTRRRTRRSRSKKLINRIEEIAQCGVSCNCAHDSGLPISSNCGRNGFKVSHDLKEYIRCYTAQQVQLGGIIVVPQLISSLLETGIFGTPYPCFGTVATLCSDAQDAISKVLEKIHPRHYRPGDEIECPDLGAALQEGRTILRDNERLYSRYASRRAVDRIVDIVRCQFSCSCYTDNEPNTPQPDEPIESGDDAPICDLTPRSKTR